MSRLERAQQWLSLVANLGVILGFILIAVQLNVNTTAIRLQNTMHLNRDASTAEIALMGETMHEAFAAAMSSPAEMTEAQIAQVWSYLTVILNSAMNTWVAYESGIATAEDWEYATTVASTYLAFEVGEIFWNVGKEEDYYPPGFIAAIEARVSTMDRNLIANQFESIVEQVRQIDRRELGGQSP